VRGPARYWLPRLSTEKKSMPKMRACSDVRATRSSCSSICAVTPARDVACRIVAVQGD
jgi:hypothetical protein